MASKLKTALMQLFNSELAIDERLKGGVELCELLENTAVDDDLREAVPEIFEKIQNILTETDVQFIKEAPLQRLRHICLEVVQKIRNVDFFRPYAPSLLSLLFKLVEQENEENVLLCVKQIIDLYKVYRPHFSADVSQFLVFVQRVYRNLKGQVFNIFKPQQVYEIDSIIDFNVEIFLPHIFTITKLQTKDIKDDGSYSTYHILPKSCFSLKVMQEIPILVVLMYQLFKQQIHQDVSAFIPLIMEFINMKPLEEHRLDPAFRQDKFIDFLAAQVKTLSFLAYVIKIYQDLVEQHSTALVKGMMNLLVTCPPSVTNMRKEFFIAARHILSAQEIRPKFLPVLDDLMNEDILIGQGYTVRDALRPLAYSTLADLTHHLRADLSLTKMALATDLFGRNMFDDSLPFSIQQMSLRLLLNLVECIRQRVAMTGLQQQQHDTIRSTVTRQINTSSARRLLLQIMRLCVLKCQLVAERFLPELEAKCSKEEIETGNTDLNTNLRSQHQKAGSCTISHTDVNAASEAPEIEQEAQVYGSHAPFLTSEVLNQGQLTFTDLRALTKSLATGMRTVVTSLTQCPHWNSSGEDAEDLADTPPSPKLLQTTELNILSDYLTFGLRMIDVLRIVSKDGQLYLRGPHSGAKYPDERFLLETLAATFIPLSTTSFREIFSSKIGYIVEWCRKSPLFYAHFAFYLLSQSSQTSNFGHILLSFLVDRLEKLGDKNDESLIYMRLLKLCFNSVNMAGTDNEHIMKLHLRRIVQGSMQYCLEAKEPVAYLTLLRTLFRSIGGGAHDKLYREFFPLLPEMLTTLNRLLRSAHRSYARDLLGELCVIVPVRLSTLLPYLSLLMEPLIYVLNCNTVNQGLRTLELCVDNMQPDFLYEHLYEVRGDMLLALYTSLHSQSEYVQKMAFKVLGKLGRYNRADLIDVQRLNLDVNEGEAGPLLRFWLKEFPQYPVDLPVRSLVDTAIEMVQDLTLDQPSILRAWQFLQGLCIAALNLQSCNEAENECSGIGFLPDLPLFPLQKLSDTIRNLDKVIVETYIRHDIHREVIMRVLGGVFLAFAVQPLLTENGVFLTFLIRHLTLVNLSSLFTENQQEINSEPMKLSTYDQICPSTTTAFQSVDQVDTRLLIDAICFIMGHEDKELVPAGCLLLDEMLFTLTATIEAALALSSDPPMSIPMDIVIRLPLLQHLANATTEMLYHPAWYVKWGGCSILMYLQDRLPVVWFRKNLLVFLRGLLHCLHNLSDQMGQGALSLTRRCATNLVRYVFEAELNSKSTVRTTEETKAEGQLASHATTLVREPSKRAAGRRKAGGHKMTAGKGGRYKGTKDSSVDSTTAMNDSDAVMMETEDCWTGNANETHVASNYLVNMVLPELMEALLSETKAVRVESRHLLHLIASCLKTQLSGLLKPHLHVIESWLPPKSRINRLANLPIATQIAVIETNYFFCQPTTKPTEEGKNNDNTDLGSSAGVGILQYFPSRRCDYRFIIDLRAVLDTPLPSPGAQSPSTLAGGRIIAGTSSSPSVNAQQTPILSFLQLQQAIDLKVAACQVLSTTHYIEAQKSATLAALFKGICSESSSVHQPAFECIRNFVRHTTIDVELRHTFVKPILQNLRQAVNMRLATVRQLAYCAELFPSTFNERFCDAIYSHLTALVDGITNRPDTLSKLSSSGQAVELATALIDLFHLIPLAADKYVSLLIDLTVRMEQLCYIETTSPLRLPVLRFLAHHPEETVKQFLLSSTSDRPTDAHANRLFLFLLTCPESTSLVNYLMSHSSILADLLRPTKDTNDAGENIFKETSFRLPRIKGPLTRASPTHLALRVVHVLHKKHPDWLISGLLKDIYADASAAKDNPPIDLVSALLAYWDSPTFVRRHACLTLIQLQQLQPDIDLEVLLEESESGRRIGPHTCTNAEIANEVLAGTRIVSGLTDQTHWDEPTLMLDCLLSCAKHLPNDFNLLFSIVVGMARLRCVGFNPLRRYVTQIAQTSPVEWHRTLFLRFVALVRKRTSESKQQLGGGSSKRRKVHQQPTTLGGQITSPLSISQYLGTPEAQFKLLAHLILPCLQHALKKAPHQLLSQGKPPKPFEANDEDLVHLYVSVLLNDEAVNSCTGLRIMYYQLASLFIYYAPEFIHDVTSKVQSNRLRGITAFAWPCVTSSLNVVDLQEKYMGLQVLAHLIASDFQIAARTKAATLQVFHCLAKGTHTEVKKIVNPALDLLLPAWVTGPEEQKALAFGTRKIMMEDHGIQSCVHMLSLIVRHADLYYPIRHHILQLIIVITSRLSAQQLPIDQRRLILDMIETTVRWDQKNKAQQNQEAQQQTAMGSVVNEVVVTPETSLSVTKPTSMTVTDLSNSPMEKSNRDQLTNLMIRFACQSIDTAQNGASSEVSARKALNQIETTLASDVWGGELCELRLGFLDRFLCPDETVSGSTSANSSGNQTLVSGSQTSATTPGSTSTAASTSNNNLGPVQSSGVFMTLEVLRVIYSSLDSPTLLVNVKHFSKSVSSLLTRHPTNVRLVRACASLSRTLLNKFPADAAVRQKITNVPELFELYSVVLKSIQESFALFGDGGNKTALLPRLQSAFLLLNATQQATSNPYAFIDRCMSQLVKLLHRLIHDVTNTSASSSPQDNAASNQLTELLINGLEIVKSRLNVLSNETRKNAFGPDLFYIIDRSKNAKLFRTVARILKEWIIQAPSPKGDEKDHSASPPPITTREKVAFFVHLWQAFPRWADQPDVVREILDCIYQVFSSSSLRTHDIYSKLEEAFCCSLLTQLPEVREKFLNLYLMGSNLISQPMFPEEKEDDKNLEDLTAQDKEEVKVQVKIKTDEDSTTVPMATDDAGDGEDKKSSNSSLLVRLLFLFVSSSWDEAHFKDNFWLPLFFDVLLCDSDFTRPAYIAQAAAKFQSPAIWIKDKIVKTSPTRPVTMDIFDTSDLLSSPVPTAHSKLKKKESIFDRLQAQQIAAFTSLKSITFRETLRGLLNIVHRRPAIATELFGQLWYCLWQRILLKKSDRCLQAPTASVTVSDHISQLSDSFADTSLLSAAAEMIGSDSISLSSPTSTTVLPVDRELSSMSPGELRGFLMPQLIRFLTSDDHVNPLEAKPSPLGSLVAGLATTTDSLLLSVPLPVLSYIGYTHNQWYSMTLFFESLCARGLRALLYNRRNSSVDNDLTYSLCPEIDGSGAASSLPEDVPLGTAALSLIALYDCMSDPDHFLSAWWYRLNSNCCSGAQRLPAYSMAPFKQFSPAASQGNDRSQSDLLAALISFSQGQLTTGLNTALSLLMPSLSSSSSSGNGFGTVSPLWVSRLGAGDSSSNAQTPSEATGLTQFSEQINKARLHEYCIKTLKILGQWESLESLSAASQTSGNLSGASTTSNVGGGSPFWGIRADAAWRHNDWSDVFSALSGLANECPRHEQWRFALIQAAACIAGSRNGDFDSFSSSSGIQSSSIETTASGSGSTAGGGASGGIGSASGGASSQVTNLLQISESESHRVMSCILREWGRLPLIINNQHVALLQACQRATEINEGNILFIQHHGHSLSGSSGSASGASVGGPSGSSAAGSRIPLTQPMYDYKTVFRSWQGRPPLISDDLYFWNDLLSWRQIVHKNIITWVFAHKFRQEQTTLLDMCQRERALSQVQMARGYRKNGLSYLAQQQLDNCSRLNSSSLFERTKQEIKLKMADLRKEELLEGLELMEKTNIQQFEKKDKARFFCYKAVFFSHFNKGDEATKNFGYATQMQDNLHKVWSVYGDFLENVYSSYPAAKREIAVSTTGIFAMQALMEAATVAGTSQHLSHSDLGKCIWLLTLDDAGDVPNSPANINQQQQQPATPQNSSIPSISTGGCSSSQQRLARTFEERASRVHPDAFLPWLPSLAVCLLRPEGQFVASALRGIMLNYPTALSSILRGLQYQLTSEVERDRRIAGALAELPPDRRRRLDEVYGSGDASGQRLGTHFCVGDDDNDVETGYELLSRRGYLKVSGSSRGQSSNQSITSSSISSGCGTGALAAKRTKKRVVVVMRGAEGERLGGCSSSVNPELEPKLDQQASAGGSSDLQDIEIDDEESEGLDAEYGGDFDDAIDLRGPRTGYLSPSVVEGLHRVNLLFAQLRQRHPGRLFIFERFVEQTGGRLLPSWSEHLLTNLSSCLSQLHAIAWAHVSRSVMTSKSLPGLRKLRTIPLPWWLTEELIDVAACCGLPKVNSGSQEREGSSSGEDRASCDAIHTAYTTLANEANSDVYFKLIREKLMTEMANVGKKTVVEVINLLTNDLIPLIERRIDLLPQSSFVTERGAGRLLELISASSNQAVYGPFLRASPGGPLQTSPPVCPIPLLELPGETIRVKCVPALMHLAASSSQSDQLHQQPHLYLVDILPRVGRVTASANFDACPARRIALRASNGRLFFYDLSCLPRELPAGKAVAALQSDMIDADMATMTPTLAAYNSWRKASPLHLFQVINDVANRHPETAKRRLGLVVPRSMEIGPQGMRLVQVGASAPAASVVAANSVAFLGSANQSRGDGGARGSGSSLLAQQWHISPTNPASSSTPTQTSTRGSGPLVVGLQSASSFDNISPAAFPHSNAFASLAEHSVEAERQLMLVTVGLPPATSSSGYAGSRGVAAEVSGQPAGLEAGCYAAGLSLVRIVDSAVGGDDKLTSRQLIAAFYDKLLTVITTVDNEQSLKQTLVRIYEELLKCVPQGAHLETPMHSRLGLLSEELNGTGRDDGALRLWAFRRFTDAESYWLFRRGIALHAGILGLVEVLFNLTALRATSLLVEPRLARIEARNLIFDLPSTGGAIPKDNFSVKVNNALVKVFASTFAPLTCASSASAPVTTVSGQRQSGGVLASSPSPSFSLPTRSTPFRLTPQLTGLICPPGVPATIGPFAASMSTMGQAMSTRRSPLTACLRTLLRDDFVLWHRGRQAAIHASLLADLLAGQPEEGVDARPQTPVHVLELSNERLIHLIQLSTDAFGHRIKGLSERSPNNEYLIDLINSASSFENLACTDPSWLPWI